jgi:hypothetical protein
MTRGKIICPHGNDPRVKATADKEYTAYKTQCAARFCGHSDKRPGGKKKPKRLPPLDFSRLSANNQTCMRKAILASIATTPAAAPAARSPVIYMLTIPAWVAPQVLAANVPHHHTLPVPIQLAFPHIILKLGSQLCDANNPAICAVVDTAAALTTGNLHFFAAIAKAYPHTVHAIYTPKDYSSITLSGIIKDIKGQSITTNLTVAFSFHLPYITREGAPITFLVAVGPNITVNTILGLPFIWQTKMIIDTADQVAELCSLDAPPFPIDFRCAQCSVPNIGAPKDQVNASHFTDIIQEITNTESLYSVCKHSALNPTIPPVIKSNKLGCPGPLCLITHVTFAPAGLPPSVGASITANDESSVDSSDNDSDDIPF